MARHRCFASMDEMLEAAHDQEVRVAHGLLVAVVPHEDLIPKYAVTYELVFGSDKVAVGSIYLKEEEYPTAYASNRIVEVDGSIRYFLAPVVCGVAQSLCVVTIDLVGAMVCVDDDSVSLFDYELIEKVRKHTSQYYQPRVGISVAP